MEEYLLRETPALKILVFKEKFEIHPSENQKPVYFFRDVDSLRIGKRINWFVSAFSFVFGFFVGGGSGDIYKERDQLKFNYRNEELTHSIKGCIQDLVKKAIISINEKVATALKSS